MKVIADLVIKMTESFAEYEKFMADWERTLAAGRCPLCQKPTGKAAGIGSPPPPPLNGKIKKGCG